ncbi:MAG: acyltransferase [Sphingomonadaceae bacterium]|nr:acyltransferase [Sphingomonadaceae bacterium]
MTENVPEARATIASLQAVRFFAALLVALDHVRLDGSELAAKLGLPFAFPIFSGRLGVEIFFLISGFIMVHITTGENGWRTRPGRFLRERAIRIVPGYWLATLTVVLIVAAARLHAAGEAPSWSAIRLLTSFLFLPHIDPPFGLRVPILNQGWTLNYEMFFYLLFAVALAFPRRRGLIFLVTAFVALAACGQLISWTVGDAAAPSAGAPLVLAVLRFWMEPIILLFLAGAVFGVVRQHVSAKWGLPRCRHAIPISFLLIALYSCFGIAFGDAGALRLPVAIIVVGLCCMTAEPPEAGFSRAALVRAGDASYSLYLFHSHVFLLLAAIWRRTALSQVSLEVFPFLALAAAVCVSLAMHRLFEKPVSKLLRRLTGPRPRPDEVQFAARW